VNPHLRRTNCQFAIFGCSECDRVSQVVLLVEMAFQVEMAFRTEMVSDLVSDVYVGLAVEHPYLCPSSVSGDCSL